MSNISRARDVYGPIQRYQTRVICLHGDHGSFDSPLRCHLLTADLLDASFEGVGIRAPPGENDYLVEFDALSYTWGTSANSDILMCESVGFPISRNLADALRALRHPENRDRYLWVDAICINQSDDKEKSQQVRNMFTIYQKAAIVVAWLGPAHADMKYMLPAAAVFSAELIPTDEIDVYSTTKALTYLYTRPWFQRIWVQQEIFAARHLVLRCGEFTFEWSVLFSDPEILKTVPRLDEYLDLLLSKKGKKSLARDAEGSDPQLHAQLEAIYDVDQLRVEKLNCFERFIAKEEGRPDFIETLLDTASLGATNRLDYIYGIIGITEFPAKAQSFQQWIAGRKQDIYIPIDYSGGLIVLAKFKFVACEDSTTLPLPSWVIDWQVAAQLLYRRRPPEEKEGGVTTWLGTRRKIDNAWDTMLISENNFSLIPSDPSPEHEQFCDDNRNSAVPVFHLILFGVVDKRYYAEGQSIWEKRKLLKDTPIWRLNFEVHRTDLIVWMVSFRGTGFRGLRVWEAVENNGASAQQYRNGGPWLLRPAGDNTFKLIACLSIIGSTSLPIYSEWGYNPESVCTTSQGQYISRDEKYRPLAVEPEYVVGRYNYPNGDRESTPFRQFIIV